MASEPFTIARHERTAPLWVALESHYTKRLAELRAQNDARKSPEDTEFLRGQISAIKELLRLAQDRPDVPKGKTL